MSSKRPGTRDLLEKRLIDLAKQGGSVEEMGAIQKALDDIERTTDREDETWALDHVIDDRSSDVEEEGDEPKRPMPSQAKIWEMTGKFRNVLRKITGAKKPRLCAECCEMAFGFKVGEASASMRDVATRNGVTVEAVSKVVDELRVALRLPVIEQSKSARAIKQYRLSNGKSKL